jgi:hypothetical protein
MVVMRQARREHRPRLTRLEWVTAGVGGSLLAALCLAWASYLLSGHAVVRLLYEQGWGWRFDADLSTYLWTADRRMYAEVIRPLLLAAGPACLALVWALRRTGIFNPVVTFWCALPAVQRAAIAGCCVLLVAGHAVNRPRELFPFVRWSMYTGVFEPAALTAYDLRGVSPDGGRVPINVGRTVPSIHRGAPRKFTETAQAALAGEPSPGALEALDAFATAVARLHAETTGTTLVGAEVIETRLVRSSSGEFVRVVTVARTIPMTSGTGDRARRQAPPP